MKKFAEHSGLNLTQVNSDILEMWREKNVFWRSVEEREGCPQFVFFEGPPSANGHPGIHHVLARTIKDTFNRYKTMKGYQVKRKAGWDTHGLPVELGVEKELGITKADIDNKDSEKYISTEDYNKKCRENVMMFTQEWRDLTEKMGYFVDLDNPYITYDNKYIETLWWLLKQFYNKGLHRGKAQSTQAIDIRGTTPSQQRATCTYCHQYTTKQEYGGLNLIQLSHLFLVVLLRARHR